MTAKKIITSKSLEPDEVRNLILNFLYQMHRNARGVKAQEIKLRALQQRLKSEHGLSQQEVSSNLDYLVQKEWVRQMRRERTFTTKGGVEVSNEEVSYKISDVGIDRVEGESRFKKQSPFGAVNISNVQGAVVFGDHNIVNNQFIPLAEHLTRLEQAISMATMPDSEKVAVIGDIETIKSQLAKPTPDRSILRQAWTAIERVVTAHGFATILIEAAKHIAPLIS
jgi:hypothetical protein